MRIPIYQVDAFAYAPFRGNPAAVCPLDRWLDDATLQSIAAENNLSETAFFVADGKTYELRWFTPQSEIDLCGHATLASAFVIFEFLDRHTPKVTFQTKSGTLTVRRQAGILAMDFPARPGERCDPPPPALEAALGASPRHVFRAARDIMAVFETEGEVRALKPRMERLLELDTLGVIVTAPGIDADFVSRFFAPKAGIPEDPVTGSAHCTLIPYWGERLGKRRMRAFQLSARGGELICDNLGERVLISGRAVLFLEGTIILETQ